jgi:hypothetical protein
MTASRQRAWGPADDDVDKNDPHPHGPHVITYSATLDVPEATGVPLTDLLIVDRRRRGAGIIGARAASARDQALLVLRWFLAPSSAAGGQT